MAKAMLNLKIQMLAGKGTKESFERFYKNLTSLDNTYGLPNLFGFLKNLSKILQFPFPPTFEFSNSNSAWILPSKCS